MSQPEEAQEKTPKTDDVLQRQPAPPPTGPRVEGAGAGPRVEGAGAAPPPDPRIRAQELKHADELAEEAEASSQEVS
jgi:hypothetical protein